MTHHVFASVASEKKNKIRFFCFRKERIRDQVISCANQVCFQNNTNLTFLAFLYKIGVQGFQNQQKINVIELTTLAINELEGRCLLHSAIQTCVE